MNHKFCPNCGKKIPTNIKFCPYCGARCSTPSYAAKQPNKPTMSFKNRFNKLSKNSRIIIIVIIIILIIMGFWYHNNRMPSVNNTTFHINKAYVEYKSKPNSKPFHLLTNSATNIKVTSHYIEAPKGFKVATILGEHRSNFGRTLIMNILPSSTNKIGKFKYEMVFQKHGKKVIAHFEIIYIGKKKYYKMANSKEFKEYLREYFIKSEAQ